MLINRSWKFHAKYAHDEDLKYIRKNGIKLFFWKILLIFVIKILNKNNENLQWNIEAALIDSKRKLCKNGMNAEFYYKYDDYRIMSYVAVSTFFFQKVRKIERL